MKKVIVIVMLVVGFSTFAQERKQGGEREKMSTEQRSQLRLKKLTLELGLNDTQQKEMSKIIADQEAKREAKMAERKANQEKGIKPTADERFARENQKLDDEMATKSKIQKILTPTQFEKWESMKKDNREHMEKKMEKRMEKKAQKDQKPE